MLDWIIGGLAIYVIVRMEDLATRVEKHVLDEPSGNNQGDQDAGRSHIGSGGLLHDPSEAEVLRGLRRRESETPGTVELRERLKAVVNPDT